MTDAIAFMGHLIALCILCVIATMAVVGLVHAIRFAWEMLR